MNAALLACVGAGVVAGAPYGGADGVLTFRGGPLRDGGAFGVAHVEKRELVVVWKQKTRHGEAPWFGGAGWTGQPAIVRWPQEMAAKMHVDGVEVIQGSLDGRVYFFDLATGKPTRTPIETGNGIKGSVSVDARGLLFVGQGLPERAPIGVHVYSLVTDKELWNLHGMDKDAPNQTWGAFDSSGLVVGDTFLEGGENGLFYSVDLHTSDTGIAPSIAPTVRKFSYHHTDAGIEDSLALCDGVAYFADGDGTIVALDLAAWKEKWRFAAGDDTDASIVVDVEDGAPMLYTGDELDRRGPASGTVSARKIDGRDGHEVWHRDFACKGMVEPRHEPGVFATPALVDDTVVFMVSRCPVFEGGTLVALDKKTGVDVWRDAMKFLAWPSPTIFHDQSGKPWLIQADAGGGVHLVDAKSGAVVFTLQLAGTIEASPAIFDNMIVLTARGDTVYGIEIR